MGSTSSISKMSTTSADFSSFTLECDQIFHYRVFEGLSYENDSKLSIYALRRRLWSSINLNLYHKAWLVIFENHNEYKYATIEYSTTGIIVHIYKLNNKVKLSQVAANIRGIFVL